MGDIADMVLDGFMCEVYGEIIDGEEPGFPRRCPSCQQDDEEE